MKIIVNIISNNSIIENYNYSDDEFIYNDKVINVNNKILNLTHLISMTTSWQENNIDSSIRQGVYVKVLVDNYQKEYFFKKDFPNNFEVFIYDMKQLALGEK